jgi:hypothetical protein
MTREDARLAFCSIFQRSWQMFQRMSKSLFAAAMALGVFSGMISQSATAAEPYVVQFRLPKWKTMHFGETAKAETHLATVKKLGCEVKAGDHGGHIDVSYRCPEWRSLAVQTDDGAHKWEKWLRASGFETTHEH